MTGHRTLRNCYPIAEQIGYSGHIFVTLNNFNIRPNLNHWGLMQQAIRDGHEIGNHTREHINLIEANEKQRYLEIHHTYKTMNEELIGEPIKTFAYPCGKVNPTVIDEVKKNHIAARGYTEKQFFTDFNYDFAANNNDYYNIPSVAIDDNLTAEHFNAMLENNIQNQGFMACLFHGIYNDQHTADKFSFSTINEKHLNNLLIQLKQQGNQLWCAPFSEISLYHKVANSLKPFVRRIKEKEFFVDFTSNLETDIDLNDLLKHKVNVSIKVSGHPHKVTSAATGDKKNELLTAQNQSRIHLNTKELKRGIYLSY